MPLCHSNASPPPSLPPSLPCPPPSPPFTRSLSMLHTAHWQSRSRRSPHLPLPPPPPPPQRRSNVRSIPSCSANGCLRPASFRFHRMGIPANSCPKTFTLRHPSCHYPTCCWSKISRWDGRSALANQGFAARRGQQRPTPIPDTPADSNRRMESSYL